MLARVQVAKAAAKAALGEMTGDLARLARAVSDLATALDTLGRDQSPLDWARGQTTLARALAQLGEATENETAFHKALACYDRAGLVLKEAPGLVLRAEAANGRGLALARLAELTGDTQVLDAAEAAFKHELASGPHRNDPVAWAMLQVQLGQVYTTRLALTRRDRGERAAAALAFQAALDVFGEEGLRSLGRHRRRRPGAAGRRPRSAERRAPAAMGVITDDMRRLVEEQQLGFVATVCPDGTPNLSPKGTTAVLDDDHLVFADIHSPRTVANLRANPAVEINVVDPLTRKGFRFKGTARIVERRARSSTPLLGFYRARGSTSAEALHRGGEGGERRAADLTRLRRRDERGGGGREVAARTGSSCGTQANSSREQPRRSAPACDQPNRLPVERDKLVAAKPSHPRAR